MVGPVLVTGGTGTLGRAVVRRLFDDGHAVRVLSRRARRDVVEDGITWATGDLTAATGLAEAVAGVETIVHCATTLGKGDVPATANLLRAAEQSGASPHMIYISIVGVDQVPMFYYRAKLEAEGLVEQSAVPSTILRATQFHDLIAKVWSAQRWSPVTLAPSGTSFQPIDIHDVAARLGELVEAGPGGRVADIGGPEVRSAKDLAKAYLAHAGRRRAVVSVPIPGSAAGAYRDGGHLAPDNRYGSVTFEQYLTSGGS